MQLDSRGHGVLREKVLHVRRVAATFEESHERGRGGDGRRPLGAGPLPALAPRRPARRASPVRQDLPNATSEPARDRPLPPVRETVAALGPVSVVLGSAPPPAAPPRGPGLATLLLPLLLVRRPAEARRRFRPASMSSSRPNRRISIVSSTVIHARIRTFRFLLRRIPCLFLYLSFHSLVVEIEVGKRIAVIPFEKRALLTVIPRGSENNDGCLGGGGIAVFYHLPFFDRLHISNVTFARHRDPYAYVLLFTSTDTFPRDIFVCIYISFSYSP